MQAIYSGLFKLSSLSVQLNCRPCYIQGNNWNTFALLSFCLVHGFKIVRALCFSADGDSGHIVDMRSR